jgi:hypothetical protein
VNTNLHSCTVNQALSTQQTILQVNKISGHTLFAQKIVHAAQKNVHPNPLVILNHNDISRLVLVRLLQFDQGLGTGDQPSAVRWQGTEGQKVGR